MKTAIKAALISAALAAVAAPAVAQPMRHPTPQPAPSFARVGFDLFQRIDSVQRQIDRSKATGQMNRREAGRATSDLHDIRTELTRATRGRHSISPVQHARFDQRIDRVAGFVRAASNDHGRPHYRG